MLGPCGPAGQRLGCGRLCLPLSPLSCAPCLWCSIRSTQWGCYPISSTPSGFFVPQTGVLLETIAGGKCPLGIPGPASMRLPPTVSRVISSFGELVSSRCPQTTPGGGPSSDHPHGPLTAISPVPWQSAVKLGLFFACHALPPCLPAALPVMGTLLPHRFNSKCARVRNFFLLLNSGHSTFGVFFPILVHFCIFAVQKSPYTHTFTLANTLALFHFL